MKLPEFQTGPVQQVGGTDEARSALLHLGNEQARAWAAGAGAAEQVGQWGLEVARGVTLVQHAEALTDVALTDAEAKKQASQKVLWNTKEVDDLFGGADQVPEELKQMVGGTRRTVTNPETGQEEELSRNDIPAWAVNPYAYKKTMDAAVQTASQKISLPGFRDQFLAEARRSVGLEYANTVAGAQREYTDWKNTKLSLLASKLAESGRGADAKNIIKFLDIPEAAREKLFQAADEKQANFQINEPQTNNDMVGMGNLVAGIQSGETKFAYTNGKGEVVPVDLSVLTEPQRKEQAKQMIRWMHSVQTMRNSDDERAQKTMDNDYTGQIIDLYTKGKNFPAMEQLLANPPPGVSQTSRRAMVNWVQAQEDRVQGKAPTQKAQTADLATVTLQQAFAEAEAGNPPSIKDPYSGEIIDPRKLDLMDAVAKHLIPEKAAASLIKRQSNLVNGKPGPLKDPEAKQNEDYVVSKLALKPNDPSISSKEVAATIRLAYRNDYNAFVQSNGGKVTPQQKRDFAVQWAADGQKTKSGFIPYFSADTVVKAPALADVPTSYVIPLQQIRAAYANQGFGATPADYGRLYRDRLKPYSDIVNDVWDKTTGAGVLPKPIDVLKLSAAVDLNKTSIDQELWNKYKIQNPSDKQRVLFQLQKEGKLKEAVFGR